MLRDWLAEAFLCGVFLLVLRLVSVAVLWFALPAVGYVLLFPAVGFALLPSVGIALLPAVGFARLPAVGFARLPAVGLALLPAVGFALLPAVGFALLVFRDSLPLRFVSNLESL